MGTLRLPADVVEQRLHLAAFTPDGEDSARERFARLFAIDEKLPRLGAVVQAALECEDVEPHLLVQEANHARLRHECRAVAVALLAEHHDARALERGS